MTPTRPGRRPTGGFTLLEVMVALGILAGALLTISEVVSGALRNHVRARQIEVATLLARGKMAALEDEFDAKGFRDFDQSDEGSFENEGHPEIRWKLDVTKPSLDLGPDAVLKGLTGKDLQDLMSGGGEKAQLPVAAAAMMAPLQMALTQVGEQMKKGAREVRLTVSWKDGAVEESFAVVTHLVVLQPTEGGT